MIVCHESWLSISIFMLGPVDDAFLLPLRATFSPTVAKDPRPQGPATRPSAMCERSNQNFSQWSYQNFTPSIGINRTLEN